MSDKIFFYTTKDKYGFCSNFYRAQIDLDGRTWATSEHYYQAQKSIDPKHQELIQKCATPKVAAFLGRTCSIRADWEDVKYDVMRKAVRAKFEQHPDLMEKLRETAPAILVEHTVGTPRPDPVWGDGSDGSGENWLGRILMEIRDS